MGWIVRGGDWPVGGFDDGLTLDEIYAVMDEFEEAFPRAIESLAAITDEQIAAMDSDSIRVELGDIACTGIEE